MIGHLPIWIVLIFIITVIITLLFIYWIIKNANVEQTRNKASLILIGLLVWIIIQSVLTLQNLYHSDANTFPPKIMLLGILPAFLIIIITFSTSNGRNFIDSLPIKNITYLHIVRVPVEIVLLLLFLNKVVPELMTFEGHNFDILSGITAPVIAYFAFVQKKVNKKLLLVWNIICLGLLFNIVYYALFSVPTLLQKFAFDQPNIAVLKFPFSLLPTFIVPAVLFAHLIVIRQSLKND
jgi:hypothetical protein